MVVGAGAGGCGDKDHHWVAWRSTERQGGWETLKWGISEEMEVSQRRWWDVRGCCSPSEAQQVFPGFSGFRLLTGCCLWSLFCCLQVAWLCLGTCGTRCWAPSAAFMHLAHPLSQGFHPCSGSVQAEETGFLAVWTVLKSTFLFISLLY